MINENSIIDELARRQQEREKSEQVVIENIEEYKLALNRIFSMNEGKLMAKYLLRFIGLNQDRDDINPAKLIEDKGKKSVYLRMIRPYLAREIRAEIEND